MTDASLITLVAGVLAAASIAVSVLVFRGDETSRRLEARMRSIARPTEPASGASILRERGIRRTTTSGSFPARALAKLGRSPHIPAERRLPWLVTAAAGGAGAVGAAYLAATLLATAASPFAAVGAGALVLRGMFGWEAQRYRKELFVQIPEALGLILRAIRAGMPVGEALGNVAREVSSPTREEFARVVSGTAIGQPVDAALFGLAERTGLTEYFFFAVTVGLQANTGGNLGETLENVAEMVRKRVAMASRVKAITSEARTSALIMALLPFVAAGGISVTTPGYLDPLFRTEFGFHMLLVGATLMIFGLLTIRSLLRSAVKD